MPPKRERKSIPKSIRENCWDKYVGRDKGTCMCFCCEKKEIRQSCFHCGHVKSVAHGGKDTIDNLRPICSSCNLSMGTMNMNVYKQRYEPEAEPTTISRIRNWLASWISTS